MQESRLNGYKSRMTVAYCSGRTSNIYRLSIRVPPARPIGPSAPEPFAHEGIAPGWNLNGLLIASYPIPMWIRMASHASKKPIETAYGSDCPSTVT